MSIETPYYRTIVNINSNSCSEEYDTNYTPYLLFCLKTKLFPIVSKLLSSNIDISFMSIPKNDKMILTVVLTKGSIPIDITTNDINTIQKYVDIFTTTNNDFCLLFTPFNSIQDEKSNKIIPSSWIQQLLPYVIINPNLNPYIDEYGLHINIKNKDYLSYYNKLVANINEQLIKFYDSGYIFNASSIKDEWQLESINDDNTIFRPLWSDQRFASDLVDFLTSRIRGNKYIRLLISENLVNRHFICTELYKYTSEFYFSSSYIYIKVNNIDEASTFTSIVMSQISKSIGRVIYFKSSHISWMHLYLWTINKLSSSFPSLDTKNCIYYQTNDLINPYIFSCHINYYDNINFLTEQIHNTSHKYLKYFENKYESSNILDTIKNNPSIMYEKD